MKSWMHHGRSILILMLIFNIISVSMTCGYSAASIKPITITYDGKLVESQTPPKIVDSRVFVPARFLFETAGATVTWNDYEKSIRARTDTKWIFFQIGKNFGYVNDVITPTDLPAFIFDGRAYIRITFAAAILRCSITWDDATRNISIESAEYLTLKSLPNSGENPVTQTPTPTAVPTSEDVATPTPTVSPEDIATPTPDYTATATPTPYVPNVPSSPSDSSPTVPPSSDTQDATLNDPKKIIAYLSDAVSIAINEDKNFFLSDSNSGLPDAFTIISLKTGNDYKLLNKLSLDQIREFIVETLKKKVPISKYNSIRAIVIYNDMTICDTSIAGTGNPVNSNFSIKSVPSG